MREKFRIRRYTTTKEPAMSSVTPQHRLRNPAPNRAWVEGPGHHAARWFTRPWTAADVTSALAGGAWFASGHHDFENAQTAALATGRVKAKLAVVQATNPPLAFDSIDAALEALYADVRGL
jgi:hypothetical protein